jgi:hypothetical protein
MHAVEGQVDRLEELVMKIAYEHLNTDPDYKVKIVSKAGSYGMAMTDTTMELVNYGDVAKN